VDTLWKETFDEYGIAKLALIHQLDLPVRDTIHLLISGIANSAIRASALLVADSTLEGFLDKMRAVTEGCLDVMERKSAMSSSASKMRDLPCKNCGKKGHHFRECKGEVTCFVCKKKGHRQFDCPSGKAKDVRALPAGATGGSDSSASHRSRARAGGGRLGRRARFNCEVL